MNDLLQKACATVASEIQPFHTMAFIITANLEELDSGLIAVLSSMAFQSTRKF